MVFYFRYRMGFLVMVILTRAGWLSETVLELLSPLGGLNSTLRPLDLNLIVLLLDRSHARSSISTQLLSRSAFDHGARVTVMRRKNPFSLDSLAHSVYQRELRFHSFKEFLIGDLGITIEIDSPDKCY